MVDSEKLVEFFIESNKLKKTMRYSSCPKRIQESSAGHSWQVTLMVPIIANEFGLNVNVHHAMEIANVHDLAEYINKKDFDSFLVTMGVLKEADKDKSEEAVMSGFRDTLSFGPRIYSLWKEYEESKTPEARFVKVLDKIESQIHTIERGGAGENAAGAKHSALYADEAVKNFPELKPLLRTIKKRLKPFLEKQGLIWTTECNYPD